MNWKFTLFAVLVMVSVSAYAVVSECSDGSEAASDDIGSCGYNVRYVFDSSTGTLTICGSGNMYSYSFSSNVPWYPYRSDVKKIVIEDGVISIGSSAFYGCTSLASVTIPDGVTSIDRYAFYGCTSLASVTIPDSVTSIGDYAFYECSSLASITIPDSVTSIGSSAFSGCTGLRELTIPISVNAVGSNKSPIFSGCTNIGKVTFAPGTGKGYDYGADSSSSYRDYFGYTPWYYSRAVLKEVVIEDGVTSIGQDAFCGCSSLASVTIPDGVTSIGSSAFSGCSSLASVTIPDSVTSIDRYAFRGCSSLASVTIPDSVTSIGSSAFSGCTGLRELVIGNGVTSIGGDAFSGCTSLSSVTIPDSVTSIGNWAFEGCTSIVSVTIPDGVTSIGRSTFSGCSSLTSVTIPDSVTSIGQDAFRGCTGLRELTIPISVNANGSTIFSGYTSIKKVTFTPGTGKGYNYWADSYTPWYYSRVKEVVIEDGVTSIGSYAFRGCSSLTSVTIPDSVTSIGSYAFYECSPLASITIPDSVTSIGSSAFSGCTGLRELTIPISVNAVGSNSSPIFSGCTNIGKVTFAPGTGKGYDYGTDSSSSYRDYFGYTPWYCSSVALEMVIEDGVTSIGAWAFCDCTGLRELTIPDSVTSIGSYAFRGCSSLTSVTIPDSVTSIGQDAFCGCSSLVSVTIPDSVTSIGNEAFYECSSLASVTIPDGVTSIGAWAFRDCTGLEELVIGNGVTSIGAWAFCGCSSLTSVIIPDSVTSIGDYVFSGCSSLASITIPDSVTSIGSSAFSGCTGLRELTIPISVNANGSTIFSGCTNIGKVTFTPGTGKGYDYEDYSSSSSHYNYYGYTPWYYSRAVLKEVVIEDGVTSIGSNAFRGCSSLASITIPDGVTSIGSNAFYRCSSLASVTIPDSVTSIGSNAFYRCSSLTSIVVDEGNEAYRSVDGVLFSKNMKTLVQYPAGRPDDPYVIPDSVTSIGQDAFCGCSSLVSVTIPDSVTSIGNEAFYECSSLVSVIIPDSVTSIGHHAFSGCTSLASVVIGNGVTSIGQSAFRGCTSLASVTIPDSVTSIGGWAFYECTGLRELTIPISVNAVRLNSLPVFDGCTNIEKVTFTPGTGKGYNYRADSTSSHYNYYGYTPWYYSRAVLKEVVIEDGVISIGSNAFCGCSSLTSVTIPDSVTSIGGWAFYGCSSLTSIILPDSVTSIDQYAFYGCTAVSSIRIGPDISSIGNRAFGDIVFYDKDAVSVLSADADSLKGGCFVKTDDRMVKVDGHMMSFYVDGKVVYRGVFVEGDDDTPIPDVPFRPGYICSWEEFELGTEDVSVNAVYVLRELTVSFDPNGGSGSMDPVITDVEHLFLRPENGFSAPDHMHFAGWAYSSDGEPIDFDGLRMADDAVLYALWAWDQYDVVYKVDGETVFTDTFGYGTEVTVRDIFQKTGYTVTEWSTEDIEVTDGKFTLGASDVVFDAVSTVNKYDVVYKVDGEIVFTDTFDYGTEVTVRETYQKTGYTVTEWSTDDAEVSDGKFVLGASDVTFSAVSAVNKYAYTVEYVDGDGNTLADPVCGTVDYGSTVDAEIKTITGYVSLSGISHIVISEDESKNVVIYTYAIIVYTITFDDGTVQTDVKYTVKDSSVDEPMVTKKKGYAGVWEEYVLDLTDKTVKAVYTPGYYRVEFVSEGNVFFWYDLEPGKEITLPSSIPSKDAEIRYVYTFSGWDGYTDGMVLGDDDVTFTAVFDSTVRKYAYTVEYVDGDGNAIADPVCGTADYGSMVDAEIKTITGYAAPSGISHIAISEDESKNIARYVYTIIQYDVVYKVDGETVFTDTFGYGTEVTVRETYQKTGYTVTEWSTDDAEVSDGKFTLGASDVVFDAASTVNQYDVVYKVDGEIVFTDTFDYGTEVTVRDMFQKMGYTVTDWSTDDAEVVDGKFVLGASDVVFNAASTVNQYDVIFISDGKEFARYSLVYGSAVVLPDVVPSKDADVRYVYTFSGWDGYTDGMVLGDSDVTFNAVFEGTLRIYSVTFYDYDGSVISSEDIGYGLPITVPEPVRESTAAYDYAFSGWTDTEGNDVDVPETVLGDMGFHAVYTETLRQYSVSFLVDGVSYAAYVLPYGDRPVLPGAPSKDPDGFYTYTFSGWDGYTEDMTVDGDRVFNALFSRSVIANTGEDGGYEVKADGEGAPFSSETISGIVDGASADPSVTMSVSVGDTLVSFDNEALRNLHGDDADLLVSRLSYGQMTQAVRDVVSDNVAYSISFGPNRNFGNGTVTVTIPYVLAEWKDPNGLFVYYVAEDGAVEEIPCTYSEGYVTFSTDHFSVYAVMYGEPPSDGERSVSPILFAVIGVIIAIGAIGVVIVRKRRAV